MYNFTFKCGHSGTSTLSVATKGEEHNCVSCLVEKAVSPPKEYRCTDRLCHNPSCHRVELMVAGILGTLRATHEMMEDGFAVEFPARNALIEMSLREMQFVIDTIYKEYPHLDNKKTPDSDILRDEQLDRDMIASGDM